MSEKIRAEIVPYSSVVGQSVTLIGAGGEAVAQLAILIPAGPPPGEDHRQYSGRIAKFVADRINT